MTVKATFSLVIFMLFAFKNIIRHYLSMICIAKVIQKYVFTSWKKLPEAGYLSR